MRRWIIRKLFNLKKNQTLIILDKSDLGVVEEFLKIFDERPNIRMGLLQNLLRDLDNTTASLVWFKQRDVHVLGDIIKERVAQNARGGF